jgi:two-component sensor histidine kinase
MSARNWDIPHRAEAVGQLRGEVRKALADWGMAVAIDDNVLIVCELVTNALRHGAPGIVLMLAVRDGQVLGMVSDEGNGLPVLRPVDELGCHGRGLHMVAELAAEWGVQQHPSGHGKGVWWRWAP